MIYVFAYRSMRRPLTGMPKLSENKPLNLFCPRRYTSGGHSFFRPIYWKGTRRCTINIWRMGINHWHRNWIIIDCRTREGNQQRLV